MKICIASILLAVLTSINLTAQQSFILEFQEPSEETAVYAQMIIESGIIEESVADLESLFALPQPIRIVFGSGLDGPLYYQGVIVMPYDFAAHLDQVFSATEYYESGEEVIASILNVYEFVLYHEVGHALVEVLNIPILGKEEDAVDNFAAVLSSAFQLDELALSFADWMDAESMLKEGTDITDEEFSDEHSMDEQRMFTIFCLIYGSDPEKYAALPSDVGMPESSTQNCAYNFQEKAQNWIRVLTGYLKE